MSDISDAEVTEAQRLAASTRYALELPPEVARALIDMDRAMVAPLGMSLRFLAHEQALALSNDIRVSPFLGAKGGQR
jgi:energy-converting hydrogenase Eha subunit E